MSVNLNNAKGQNETYPVDMRISISATACIPEGVESLQWSRLSGDGELMNASESAANGLRCYCEDAGIENVGVTPAYSWGGDGEGGLTDEFSIVGTIGMEIEADSPEEAIKKAMCLGSVPRIDNYRSISCLPWLPDYRIEDTSIRGEEKTYDVKSKVSLSIEKSLDTGLDDCDDHSAAEAATKAAVTEAVKEIEALGTLADVRGKLLHFVMGMSSSEPTHVIIQLEGWTSESVNAKSLAEAKAKVLGKRPQEGEMLPGGRYTGFCTNMRREGDITASERNRETAPPELMNTEEGYGYKDYVVSVRISCFVAREFNVGGNPSAGELRYLINEQKKNINTKGIKDPSVVSLDELDVKKGRGTASYTVNGWLDISTYGTSPDDAKLRAIRRVDCGMVVPNADIDEHEIWYDGDAIVREKTPEIIKEKRKQK